MVIFIREGFTIFWKIFTPGLDVNLSKTNIMHVRPKRKLRFQFMFLFNKRPVPFCTHYKYLGCNLGEYLEYKLTTDMLVDSAGRALSFLITKMIKNKGLPCTKWLNLVSLLSANMTVRFLALTNFILPLSYIYELHELS